MSNNSESISTSSTSSENEGCDVHIIDSENPTDRIYKFQACDVCSCRIIGTNKRWMNWNFLNDIDPDNVFPDIRSKYYAIKRIKRRPNINLDYSREQKEYTRLLKSKMNYWMNNPKILKEIHNSNIYTHKGYECISVDVFLDTL